MTYVPRSIYEDNVLVTTAMLAPSGSVRINRYETTVAIRYGTHFSLTLSYDSLRDLVNAGADVLDGWYEDQGKAARDEA